MLILGSSMMRKPIPNESLYAIGSNINYSLGISDSINRSSPVVVTTIPSLPNQSWVTITSGYGHVAALNSKGQLYIWGDNTYGQWGQNDVSMPTDEALYARNRSSPTLVQASGSFTMISTGGLGGQLASGYDSLLTASNSNTRHFAMVKSDGTLWTWGEGSKGKLGHGDTVTRSSPQQVGTKTNWTNVACGYDHMAAIDSTGTLYVWGNNASYQLGLNDTINRSSPTALSGSWSAVYANASRTLAKNAVDGYLYWTGNATQAGVSPGLSPGYYPQSTPNASGFSQSLTQITTASNFSKGSFGPIFGLLIKNTGALYAAGRNQYGQLGINNTFSRSSFVQVGAGTNWSKVSVGLWHSLGLTNTGNLYVWGLNDVGQLGLGDSINRSSPTLLASGVQDIQAVDDAGMFVKTDGTLWMFGDVIRVSGDSGLRDGGDDPDYYFSTGVERSPILVTTGLSGSNSVSASWDGKWIGGSVGYYVSNGEPRMWGRNETTYGAWLYEKNKKFRKMPGSWSSVSSGGYHVAAVKSSGTLFTWGYNIYGRLGHGDTINRSSPTAVNALNTYTIKEVHAGGATTAVLTGAGPSYTLWTWGYGAVGTLGHNLTTSRSAPIIISAGWSRIFHGGYSMMGINSSGALYSWGSNTNGELGLNDTIGRSSPALVMSGLSSANINVGSGGSNAAIIKSDGSLWTVGANAYGQLGLGDFTSRSNFTQVGSSSWTAVSSGYVHMSAIDVSKRLFTWGRNSTGQLGVDPTLYTTRQSPVQIGTVAGWNLTHSGGPSLTNGTTWAAYNSGL